MQSAYWISVIRFPAAVESIAAWTVGPVPAAGNATPSSDSSATQPFCTSATRSQGRRTASKAGPGDALAEDRVHGLHFGSGHGLPRLRSPGQESPFCHPGHRQWLPIHLARRVQVQRRVLQSAAPIKAPQQASGLISSSFLSAGTYPFRHMAMQRFGERTS